MQSRDTHSNGLAQLLHGERATKVLPQPFNSVRDPLNTAIGLSEMPQLGTVTAAEDVVEDFPPNHRCHNRDVPWCGQKPNQSSDSIEYLWAGRVREGASNRPLKNSVASS